MGLNIIKHDGGITISFCVPGRRNTFHLFISTTTTTTTTSFNQTFRGHRPFAQTKTVISRNLTRTNNPFYNGTTTTKKNITCNPCAPGLVPPLPLALDEFGAQTPELHPPP